MKLDLASIYNTYIVRNYVTLQFLHRNIFQDPKFLGTPFLSLLVYMVFFLACPEGGRRSPAVACWASDHWVASSNPLSGKFRN